MEKACIHQYTFNMFLQDEDFFGQSFVSLLLQEEFLFVLQEDFCQTKLEVAVSQDLITDSRRGGFAVNLWKVIEEIEADKLLLLCVRDQLQRSEICICPQTLEKWTW